MSNITRDKYRKFLLESLIELEETVDNLNLIILNLAMAGEWKEIDAMFEVGETLHTKFEDLRSISDANVKKLIAATDELAAVFGSIKNVNAITRKEINAFLNERDDDLPY